MNSYSFFLIFCSIPFFASSQNTKNKTLLIIGPYSVNPNCEHVVFKVSDSKIEIDNCYDMKFKEFKTIKTISLSEEKLIEEIFNMSTAKLKQHARAINGASCDNYRFPMQFIVIKKRKNIEIEWENIKNCYPAATKKIAEPLLDLFEKYKNI
ncbi:MAG: hypothetical protein JKY03_09965 [Aureispira sp.]|nr:hypothetical protein [Aureispira sp.]